MAHECQCLAYYYPNSLDVQYEYAFMIELY